MITPFCPQNSAAVQAQLAQLADPQYKEFQESLMPGISTAYGVRLPELRKLAKQILKGAPADYLTLCPPSCFEEVLLRGMVLGGLNIDWKEKQPLVEEFLPFIDNWAVCDTFCSGLKPRSVAERQTMWEFLKHYYTDDREYFVRFAVVMQLAHFVDEEHLEEGLSLLTQGIHPGYYVKMAVAWAVSVWFVSFPKQVEELLERNCFSPWVQNKAIQKIRESRRVGKEVKDSLLRYKR